MIKLREVGVSLAGLRLLVCLITNLFGRGEIYNKLLNLTNLQLIDTLYIKFNYVNYMNKTEGQI